MEKEDFAWILFIIILNTAFLVHLYPPSSLFSEQVLTTDDYAWKYYESVSAAECLLSGSLKCYDEGTFLEVWVFRSTQLLFVLMMAVLSFLPQVMTYKFLVFLSIFSLPLWFLIIGKNFGLAKRETMVLVVLAIVFMYSDTVFRGYNYFGMYNYTLGVMLGIVAISYFSAAIIATDCRKLVSFCIFSVISLLAHHFSVLIILFGVIIISLTHPKEMRKIGDVILRPENRLPLLSVLGISIFAVVLAAVMIFSLDISRFQPSNLSEAMGEGILTLRYDLQYFPVRILTYCLGIISLLFMLKGSGERLFFLSIAGLALSMLFFGYFGSLIDALSYLKPRRMTLVAALILLIPIASFFSSYFKRSLRAWLTVIGAALIISVPAYFFYYQSALDDPGLRHGWGVGAQILTEVPEQTEYLLSWIRLSSPDDAVFLVEGSSNLGKRRHMYGGHYSVLFPSLTNRSFIVISDATHTKPNRRTAIPFLKDGRLDSRAMDTVPEHQFLERVRWSGVTHIIVFSDPSITALQNYDGLLLDYTSDLFWAFRIEPTTQGQLNGYS